MSNYHLFSLPVKLIQTLTPRNLINESSTTPSKPSSPEPVVPSSTSGSRACNICLGVIFVDVEQQRTHFRSDWHRYNVKNRLNGGQPVTEVDFNQLIDNLEESISGSESSDDDSSGDSDAVDVLVNKQTRRDRSASPTPDTKRLPRTALTWFHSPPSTQIGVYRILFPAHTPEMSYLQALRDMQTPVQGGRKWAMFMVAGGHFAGAVVRVSKPAEQEEEVQTTKKPKKPKPDTEVLKHKTFHRYTTRRKQGGSQSLNDNAKGKATSAGALLRRYGEQALTDDIRNLIQDWAEEINECELIFIRASGSNRKIFLDYDGSVMSKGDERLRTFPFPTRRPTQSELSRCLLELTKVKVSHLTEDALRAQDEAYLASLPKPKPVPSIATNVPQEPQKPKPIKLSKEEEIFREKWARLLDMVSKGRLEPLKSFWEREGSGLGGIDARIPEWTGEKHAVTLLQLSAYSGHEEVTQWLLEDMHADPTVTVPQTKAGKEDGESGNVSDNASNDLQVQPQKVSQQTAYDLSKTRGVRDIFRRCAGAHPDWWDWLGAARVPSVLSKEMEEERDEKKKARRKGLKDRVKEREAREKEKEKDKPEPPQVEEAKVFTSAPSTGPRKLGGSAGDVEGIAGLTPEMRAKIERERRARAAEARLKGLGAR